MKSQPGSAAARHALAALAATAALAGCSQDADGGAEASAASAPPAVLMALAPGREHARLATAERHILVVRHARRDPDCGALDCPLTEEGVAEADGLGVLLNGVAFNAVYASAACRTADTARRATGLAPAVYRARDDVDGGCDALGLSPGETTRSETIEEAADSAEPWMLVADHSNYVCAWIEGMGVAAPPACVDGQIDESNYGDIFWLSLGADDAWSLTVIADAFGADE